MSFRRDPLDRRYPERMAASTLASLIVHALLAALLFTVLASSSQEGASESVSGGEVISLERRTPVTVVQPPAVRPLAVPLLQVPRFAPQPRAPLAQPARQRPAPALHELAREVPSAPPNPRPIPQQSLAPVLQTPQPVFAASQASQIAAAAPVNVATALPFAPRIAPLATASPRPSPSPAATEAARPSASPLATRMPPATAAPRVTEAPSPSPGPSAPASAPPAAHPGIPSPAPAIAVAKAVAGREKLPSPAPKGSASPGPSAGSGTTPKAALPRPIAVPPTPSPATPAPHAVSKSASNLNARLRALLPSNPVNPTMKSYTPHLSLQGRLDPTPPPEVLAATKYLYDVRGTGNEARVKMWVTKARDEGPTTICTGWLVRYPQTMKGGYAPVPANDDIAPANGGQLSIGGGHGGGGLGPFWAGSVPIVEGLVTQPCDGRHLVPFAASPAPSP